MLGWDEIGCHGSNSGLVLRTPGSVAQRLPANTAGMPTSGQITSIERDSQYGGEVDNDPVEMFVMLLARSVIVGKVLRRTAMFLSGRPRLAHAKPIRARAATRLNQFKPQCPFSAFTCKIIWQDGDGGDLYNTTSPHLIYVQVSTHKPLV